MWKEENNTLIKEFKFPDFISALAFVNKVGELAEEANHHPDIELSWGKVIIKLTTHSEGRVTERDKKYANKIDNRI
ncbi:4a-hydroxytetrahydrobiopterin dehydratase [Candidatus Saccharibacteria bacterium]|nr:4a-hydroxytetrahydrobiopterin dehydratase [Candidatus Saccharibacteria bacterium]